MCYILCCGCRTHSNVCAKQYSYLSRHILCVQLTTESFLETDSRLNQGEASSLTSVSKTVCRRQCVADRIVQNGKQLIIQGFSWHIFNSASSVSDISSLIFPVIRNAKVQDNIVLWSDIIIIFINCKWVDTRWQWLFYVYTECDIDYY
jgi:hypothetical protein